MHQYADIIEMEQQNGMFANYAHNFLGSELVILFVV